MVKRPIKAGLDLELESGMKTNLLSQKAKSFPKVREIVGGIHGRVLPPLLMYMFGVPAGVCLLLWVFFFRGR